MISMQTAYRRRIIHVPAELARHELIMIRRQKPINSAPNQTVVQTAAEAGDGATRKSQRQSPGNKQYRAINNLRSDDRPADRSPLSGSRDTNYLKTGQKLAVCCLHCTGTVGQRPSAALRPMMLLLLMLQTCCYATDLAALRVVNCRIQSIVSIYCAICA